jgi:hypothetical protein
MADSVNPNANTGKSSKFLPKFYRTDSNKKFLQATIDQLTRPGTVKKINGFIGRETAKATTGDDIFINAANSVRQRYQLEPGFVVKDSLDNTTFFKDYQDYINQLSVFGGNVNNHQRLNDQEMYSWDPHINWDMFVNFQNYYWVPYGPAAISVFGQQLDIISEYAITLESQSDNDQYIFTPPGSISTSAVKLYRGQTYIFNVDSPSNPLMIKTARSSGTNDPYVADQLTYTTDTGVNTLALEKGTIRFTVPYTAPDLLFYQSTSNSELGGVFKILSIDENTSIDVEKELLGTRTYTLPDGTPLSNGMKIRFIGNVTPSQYSTSQYYVEGVGNQIKLVDERDLELFSPYTTSESILFDTTPFDSVPFSDATSFAGTPEYIVINRSSKDRNPWSRYNRWFHKDVISKSALVNDKQPEFDQTYRAVRPIIEFDSDLRLFNFGQDAVPDIDLVDTFTTDVFSTIEGSVGYNIDGINVAQGQRILFLADNDVRVKNNIYKVDFLVLGGQRQIHLIPQETPSLGQVAIVREGVKNQGQSFWYDGSVWKLAQQKTSLNQQPLFDVVDASGNSFGNNVFYEGTTFEGTKLFSYKTRETPAEQRGDKPFSLKVGADATLGFPLSFRNIENIGDIVFNFNLAIDSFEYKVSSVVKLQKIDIGYLKQANNYVNGWQRCTASTRQAALRVYKNSKNTKEFEIDIFDDKNNLSDLEIKIYVNGNRLDRRYWSVIDDVIYKKVILVTPIKSSDVLTIKAYTAQAANKNGYYEIPSNLQNNPLNNSLEDFTLGEVIDHVSSIVDNTTQFSGEFPGSGNLRDLGNVTQFGTKFVQHSGPASLSLYHITSKNNNIINAIDVAREEYNKFKKTFLSVALALGVESAFDDRVDLIMQQICKDKPKNSPYYFSDMIPYTARIRNTLPVVDYRIKTYPLTNVFTITELSSKAVIIYVTSTGVTTQLLYGKDYTFDPQGFVIITAELQNGDTITIDEFENTNGCFVPPTPTKLGIWPKYEPKIYLDTSLVTPRTMIQGHDGSQILAYGDFRDGLILELEKRIFNNIKVEYNPEIFDIYDIQPGYNRVTDYSLEEFNAVLAPDFYKWTSLIDRDFTKPLSFDKTDPFTFNYRFNSSPDGRSLPGNWKGVHRWMLDTDRPNLCPWEMLGFSMEPSWWQEVYGPAPYTRENKLLWNDLASGTIRQPGTPSRVDLKFARPFLTSVVPVNEDGNILSPLISGIASGVITQAAESDYVFGDVSPVESAWRKSSHYPFSFLKTVMILTPAKTFGVLLDRSRIVRNNANQIIYKDTGLRVRPQDIKIPSIYSSNEDVKTAGIINYIIDFILGDSLKSYNEYVYDLKNITAKLSYRIGGFTSKEKFNLLLDSKTPLSQGSVFIPQEDYDIILNTSSPIKKITYSGVIITKTPVGFGGVTGYEIKGYSKSQPYFKYYLYSDSGANINVGGISESFSQWIPNSRYAAGKIVEFGQKYYRAKVLHTSNAEFNLQYYEPLAELPIVGGQNATIRASWDRSSSVIVPYGTKFRTVQEVVDFLLGYGEWLKDEGFVFEDFNTVLSQVANWETSAKEFLFWTTQNWSIGEDKWEDWRPNVVVRANSIVRFNGEYYRASEDLAPAFTFDPALYTRLAGLTNLGASVISLSPSAAKVTFSAELSVVDDIRNDFYSYEIFKVDGTPISPNFLNSYRDDTAVSYIPQGPDGIYSATFYLVQKEQVVVLENKTMFNDNIYNVESGYRQERIKVAGYVSTNWQGSFDVPGFIFDQAKIQNWESWKDYSLGDIVKYKEFYFSASKFLPGTETFNFSTWLKLETKPTPQLLPNWSYKAGQFNDFYSLDSDNFDSSQQQIAQHLVGYQKRQYLNNIIQDDVSEFKFFQGMIIEKGTQNVLNKLFDVLSADDKDSITFYEEWAIRMGQYGASSAFDNAEFVLDESLFKNNPQGFELVNSIDNSVNDFIIRQTPNEVYLKPIGYNNAPWPVASNSLQALRTPGHVRADQVKAILATIDDIVTKSVTDFIDGDYIWCGFENNSWNVYRYSSAGLKITNASYSSTNKEITLTTETAAAIEVGSWLAIDQTTFFNGFYKVKSILNNSVTLDANLTLLPPPSFTEQQRTLVFTFKPQKIKSINELDSVASVRTSPGELLWTGGQGTSEKWTTWQYNNAFVETDLINTGPIADLGRGKRIVINTAGTVAASTDNLGRVIIYDKAGIASPWIQRQTILKPTLSVNDFGENNADYVGDVIAISPNGRWLAVGTPLASKVSTSPEVNQPYTKVDASDILYNSNLTNQGVITLYQKDNSNTFTLVDSIISPAPISNELFGSNLLFGNDYLFIAAKGANNNTGKVYRLSYLTVVRATTSYNPSGSAGTTVKVSSTNGIESGMAILGDGFNNGQTVVSVHPDGVTLTISAPPDLTPSNVISFTTTGWQYDSQSTLPSTNLSVGAMFGNSMAISKDESTLVVSAPYNDVNGVKGKVFFFTRSSAGAYVEQSPFLGEDYRYGEGLAVSNDGSYIAISSVLFDGITVDQSVTDQGKVSIFVKGTTGYTLHQTLVNANPSIAQFFGSKLSFMNDYNTLVVYSPNGFVRDPLTFDIGTTTFDGDLTQFLFNKPDTGRIDIYDRYDSNWVFSESLTNEADRYSAYSSGFAVADNKIMVGSPYQLDQGLVSGKIYDYSKAANTFSWMPIHKEGQVVDISRIKRAFLYNKTTNKIVEYLDVIDSIQGKIPGNADQEIKFKTFYDPATYSIGTSAVAVDSGMAWTKSQVGTLWWDLRTAKFIDSRDADDVVYRNSTWNTLFPEASIDVYEWVESRLLPAEWNAQADTEAGLSAGISGTSLYGNSVYSVVKKYDNIAKTFRNTYYYWVKNKRTIPNVVGRTMSSSDVAELISNPRGMGYRYLALTSNNSFSLVNCRSLVQNKEVVLSVEYWTSDKTDQNIHSEWKLLSNNNRSSIPKRLEEKWFDSLCGKDSAGRPVPDDRLPPKLKYGIENRPRQAMFVNRFEALKQFIEKANQTLLTVQIVDKRDISDLNSFEEIPSNITGLYDTTVDTELEIRFANIGGFRKAILTIGSIVDGKIASINIVERGSGYLVAPYLSISGQGINAQVRTIINASGQVIGTTIVNAGEGYDNNTTVAIRNYSVLVQSDSQVNNAWSIYSYEPSTQLWSRIKGQSYDTRRFWAYVDWYAPGFNQFTSIDYAVETISDLGKLSISVGQTVKIRTTSDGTWLLLQKYSNTQSIDWTQSYQVVAQESGSIQLSSNLYQFANTVYGYDSSLYDGGIFDNSASIELRIILDTLKNKILVDDLRTVFLNLFFNSIRYAFSEQTYIDWAFKTSFVKAQHNVGELEQKITYKNDNLDDYEQYINEVKPYRTTIREYTSAYGKLETAGLSATDFDLPAHLENTTVVPLNVRVTNGIIEASSNVITQYPWKHWLDNVGFEITDIIVVDGGSGYITPPQIRLESTSGSGAQARAFVSNGRITRIVLLNNGSKYLSAPTVVLDGNTSGTPARAVAIIGNSVVRSNLIKIKFDRITQGYFITQLSETETFTGTGSQTQFVLKWSPDIRVSKSSVSIKLRTSLVAEEVLRDTYTITSATTVTNGSTSYYGIVTFDIPPALGSTITVSYIKDWAVLSAADRIQHYYDPASGELGKDLAQLMDGIDYGGVVVSGLGFDLATGWDSLPFFSDKWDTFDATFDDYIVTVSANTRTFLLPYTPTAGMLLNVYHAPLYHESYVGDSVTTSYKFEKFNKTSTVTVKTTVDVIGVTTEYVQSGSAGTTLKVLDTTGIVAGMSIIGTGFASGQTVSSVTNDTTLILSNVPNNAPSGDLFFTNNVYGTNVLEVSNTSSVDVGDILTLSPAITDTIAANTSVVRIISNTKVQLDQILYKTVVATDATFTRKLVTPTDYVVNINGVVTLATPVHEGSSLNVDSLLSPVRIDDENYGTSQQLNSNAVMPTVIVGNNPVQPFVITVPNTVVINTGDQFIIRKITSDGSVKPQDSDYDTALSGGNLAYSTATGIAAEDILIDGDSFVSPTSSPAPEEIVPGQIVDTLAIKVFDKPSSGSASIRVDSYLADGTNKIFTISQRPNSRQAVIVKFTKGNRTGDILESVSSIKTEIEDYSVLYNTNEVVFVTPPAAGELVSIFSIGYNGTNILDLDYFTGNGVTTEFVTQASWVDPVTYLVYVNGVPTNAALFKTDVSYETSNRIGIRLAIAPPINSIINYIIVSGSEQTFSVAKTEKIIANDGDTVYNLQNISGNALPNESNMIIRVGQEILKGPNNSYFTITGTRLNYIIDPSKFLPFSISTNDVVVLADGILLSPITDYTVDLSGITIKISSRVRQTYLNKQLIISIKSGQGYVYIPDALGVPAQLQLATAYPEGTEIEVTTFFNHNVLDIQRTAVNITANLALTPNTIEYFNYVGLIGGFIPLDRPVIDDYYVWVLKNGVLLTPSVDFKVNENKQSITLALPTQIDDEFTLITYGSNVLATGIAYLQFKDMLNRVHFKRLSANKQTKLSADLKYNDTVVIVEDASNFDIPNPANNKPGVIEIRGERIEYFTITGNTLGQLRRGTLGTGTPTLHAIGSYVQDIGSSETVPYTEDTVTERVISNGTDIVSLNSPATAFSTAWKYQNRNMTDAEVVALSNNAVEVFVSGNRLKKNDYQLYDVALGPTSPAADRSYAKEFTVSTSEAQIELDKTVEFGTIITVVKRLGKSWDSDINIQTDDSKIANFLKATPGIWYTEIRKSN